MRGGRRQNVAEVGEVGEVAEITPSHQSPITSPLFSEYMLQKSKNWVNKCQAMQRILKESQRNKLYPQKSATLNI